MGARARLRRHRLAPAHAEPRPTLMIEKPLWRRPLVGVVWLFAATALSAGPGFWQAATQADFLRGEVDQLSIDEHGRLRLGPELARVHDAGTPYVWAAVAAADGTLFLGTGNDGKVLKVEPSGRSSVFYDSAEMEVHALAAAPNGGLYAATSPDGRIYRLDAKGEATPFFDPDDKYIWSLAVDRDGSLFAGRSEERRVGKERRQRGESDQ